MFSKNDKIQFKHQYLSTAFIPSESLRFKNLSGYISGNIILITL